MSNIHIIQEYIIKTNNDEQKKLNNLRYLIAEQREYYQQIESFSDLSEYINRELLNSVFYKIEALEKQINSLKEKINSFEKNKDEEV